MTSVSSAIEQDEHIFVTLELTTNGDTPSGQTHEIMVDVCYQDLFSGQALFRKMPKNDNIMIVRDNKGKFLTRHDKDGMGVSLASYLFGRLHMRRINKDDSIDFTAVAYKPDTGRPAMIWLLRTPESTRPVDKLYETEYLDWKAEQDALKASKIKQEDEPMAVPECDDLIELKGQLNTLQSKIDLVKQQEKGAKVNCPCCGEEFTKKLKISVFCSGPAFKGLDGKDCKSQLNSEKVELRKKIAKLEGTTPEPKTQQVAVVEPIVDKQGTKSDNDDTFKTIGTIPFTLKETQLLIGDTEEQQEFKTVRGISFSLSEMRKLTNLE